MSSVEILPTAIEEKKKKKNKKKGRKKEEKELEDEDEIAMENVKEVSKIIFLYQYNTAKKQLKKIFVS